MDQPSPWRTRPLGMVARATAVVILLGGLAAIIVLGRVVFFMAFFAGLVAAFLSVPAGLLERLRVPRVVATVVSTLLLLALLVGLGALAWPTLREQLAEMVEEFPQALMELLDWIQRQVIVIVGDPGAEAMDELADALVDQVAAFVAGALPVLNTLLGALAGLLVALAAGFYLAIEAPRFARHAVRVVPPAARARLRGALDETGGTLRRWMLGTVINMISVGVMTTIVLWILGIPAPFALGFIAGVLEFVPIVGPILAAIPAVVLALIVSPELALWVILAFIVIQQVESNFLSPLVMRGVVKLPPALIILFQALMSIMFGFLGLFLAVPLLIVILVLVRRLYVEPMEEGRAL